jgi:stress-induced morphogen
MSDETAGALNAAIADAIPDAEIEVIIGNPGHFSLRVTSKAFEGKTLLAKQRLVYSAITDLMAGDMAPVHAIDKLETLTP